jgi:two-component system response regulator AgrA
VLNVIICDDNKLQRTRIKSIIEKVILIDNLDMSIIMDTDDPHAVIETVTTVSNTGLYFLDVKLDSDISGIELAESIRKHDPRGFIVFVSGYPDNQYDVFVHRLEVMDFIDKADYAQIRERIESCIRTANTRYLAQTNVKSDVLRFKWQDRIKSVEYKDIIYIETSGSKFDHQVVLYTPSKRYQWSSSLTSLP